MQPDDELLDVVDAADRVVWSESRARVHELGLRHRGVHVFLFTPDGKMLIQQRSADRASSPSLFDCSISEHVQAGENYLEAAARGLREELALDTIALAPLAKIAMLYGPNDDEISMIFRGEVNPVRVHFDPHEISGIAYHSSDELDRMIEAQPERFCGWFIELWRWYLGRPAKLTVLETFSRAA